MKRKTSPMPMRPARMLAARNSATCVALLDLKVSSLSASGRAPYFSVVTRVRCSAVVKSPLIWPLPSRIGSPPRGPEAGGRGGPDEPPDLLLVGGARKLHHDAVAAQRLHDRFRDAAGVDAVLDDRADRLHVALRGRRAVRGERLVLAAQAALQVQPEARFGERRRIRAGTRELRQDAHGGRGSAGPPGACPRTWRWYVIAKRCASSRRRCTRYRAGLVAGNTMGSLRSGRNSSSRSLARPASGTACRPSSSRTARAALTCPLPPSTTTRSGSRQRSSP